MAIIAWNLKVIADLWMIPPDLRRMPRMRRSLDADHRPIYVGSFECEVGGEMPAHRTSYIYRPFKSESFTELSMEIKKKALVQPIFLLPPFEGFWGQTFTMIGKIEGYDPVHRSHFSVVEEMAPLPASSRPCADRRGEFLARFLQNKLDIPHPER